MVDFLHEIFATLKQNRMRTVLTGLSVSWGIFILIALLAAGNGLRNGVLSNFSDRSKNSVQTLAGSTSKPYRGLKSERALHFTEKELKRVKEELPETRFQTPIFEMPMTVTYKTEYNSYSVVGVHPSYAEVMNVKIAGRDARFINTLDCKQSRKVVVIDKQIEKELFKGEAALGHQLKINGIVFTVVGVNDKKNERNTRVYVPFETAKALFSADKKYYSIAFTLDGVVSKAENEAFTRDLREVYASTMLFDTADYNSVWIWNTNGYYEETMKIFSAINLFIALIGILTLIAGIVGVSNIMLVSVKERTREFGIRKAIGAKPRQILLSVVIEAIIITTFFGYLGMLSGIGLSEIVSAILSASPANPDGMTVFKNPEVELSYVYLSTTLLIVAGAIAGYIPAKRAVSIKPIEAMREE